MLKDIGVDWRDKNLIAKLYLGQRAVVRIDGKLFGYCITGQGVRQGCSLFPLLFNLYIQYVINEAMEDIQEGATPDYRLGTVGKCLGHTTSKGPTKDGCKIC